VVRARTGGLAGHAGGSLLRVFEAIDRTRGQDEFPYLHKRETEASL